MHPLSFLSFLFFPLPCCNDDFPLSPKHPPKPRQPPLTIPQNIPNDGPQQPPIVPKTTFSRSRSKTIQRRGPKWEATAEKGSLIVMLPLECTAGS